MTKKQEAPQGDLDGFLVYWDNFCQAGSLGVRVEMILALAEGRIVETHPLAVKSAGLEFHQVTTLRLGESGIMIRAKAVDVRDPVTGRQHRLVESQGTR